MRLACPAYFPRTLSLFLDFKLNAWFIIIIININIIIICAIWGCAMSLFKEKDWPGTEPRFSRKAWVFSPYLQCYSAIKVAWFIFGGGTELVWSIEIYSCRSMPCYEWVANPFLLHYNWHKVTLLAPVVRRGKRNTQGHTSYASTSTFGWFLSVSDTLFLSCLFSMQAALFACLGVLFMIMSLSFIIIDWVLGGIKSGGSH